MTTQPVHFRTIGGVRIRYADTEGLRRQTIVLTSPWPERLYAFPRIWATLSEHARLFAVDLPGFGASERRDDLLAPRAMGGILARLVAEVALDRPYIVAPDVGTAAGREPFRGLDLVQGPECLGSELGQPNSSAGLAGLGVAAVSH